MDAPVNTRAEKIRLDKLLVDLGHAASRERAQALILAGRVLVDEQKLEKPGHLVLGPAAIRLLGDDLRARAEYQDSLARGVARRGGCDHRDRDRRGRLPGLPQLDLDDRPLWHDDRLHHHRARLVLRGRPDHPLRRRDEQRGPPPSQALSAAPARREGQRPLLERSGL